MLCHLTHFSSLSGSAAVSESAYSRLHTPGKPDGSHFRANADTENCDIGQAVVGAGILLMKALFSGIMRTRNEGSEAHGQSGIWSIQSG